MCVCMRVCVCVCVWGGGGGGGRLKNHCLHEREILQDIRHSFESLRNVKVVYIVFTWSGADP